MIATGSPELFARKTEVVDVVSGEICADLADLADFPMSNYGAVGANLHGTPVVCGGGYSSIHYQKCYKFTDGEWQEFASTNEKRYIAAGVMHKKKFHVFGGYVTGSKLQTSEMISIDGGVEYGPNLPFAVTSHAITSINATVSILSGGGTFNSYSPLTWYFNHETGAFSSGPSLLSGRRGHGSATNVDRVTKAKTAIITGGYKGLGVYLNSTEMLINGQWQPGTIQCKEATCFNLL